MKSWFSKRRENFQCKLSLWQVKALFKGKEPVIAIDLAAIGEAQFLLPLLEGYLLRYPSRKVVMFHQQKSVDEFNYLYPQFDRHLIHFPYRYKTKFPIFQKLALYITTEQFLSGPNEVYTLSIFHGQPSKGLTFRFKEHTVINANDSLFLYGPLHREALDKFLQREKLKLPPHLRLHNVGFIKTDSLINGQYDRTIVLTELNLPVNHPTILYAPAFNEGASLREYGLEILRSLVANKDFNIIAKLPIDCLQSTQNMYATGGIDWFEVIGKLQKEHSNFRLYHGMDANPVLVASDVLITCISSISFDFMAIGKPVIFIETPKFYKYLSEEFFPGTDVSQWMEDRTVNGGKEFGIRISSPKDLSQALHRALHNSTDQPSRNTRDFLLYNPGKATETALDHIDQLLREKPISRRPISISTYTENTLSTWLSKRLTKLFNSVLSKINQLLATLGLTIVSTGLHFLPAREVQKQARRKGLSVTDYLEKEWSQIDPRQKGRRDRIIRTMKDAGCFCENSVICEIGAGTGRYVESVLRECHPSFYWIYETNPGWRRYLIETYDSNKHTTFKIPASDGKSLKFTSTASVDLIHAHGVFTYIPFLQSLEYIREISRICQIGGTIVFDCFLEQDFPLAKTHLWLKTEHRFPVIIPQKLLLDYCSSHSLTLQQQWNEITASGSASYLMFRKQ